jgi:hypothetical protein
VVDPENVITSTTAFLMSPAEVASNWWFDRLTATGSKWNLQRETFEEKGFRLLLTPHVPMSCYAFVSCGEDRCAVFTNGPLGTDVGMLPSLAARDLGVRGIRATVASGRYPANILEVFEPDERFDPLHLRRSISCANDGGRWRFDVAGLPFCFEDQPQYLKRRIRARFTPPMLTRYLFELGFGDELSPEFVWFIRRM